jgi:predicted ArsR family transcriptional regulator
MPDQRGTSRKPDSVYSHPLRDALLALIDRDGTTTSTVAARELGESTGACSFHLRRLEEFGVIEPVPDQTGRGKPWRRASTAHATLNRELEDVAYATWLSERQSDSEDFAFSEVVALTEGQLMELRARLLRVVRDFATAQPATGSAATAVVVRAFPLRE